ncbi:glutaredoxin domain-containing protein [Photobacterium phosphoreum]|uniref:glutaredoxin domain-containing protein n=1 Tax=Photobacterium phosphoreum TaxID=659 RepID=UPI0005D385AE|nr:glutaredoxin domain-containing protein [Photobacterium phosphoreum]KJF85700.1 glutaredoxin [Photobacterium phosphoreum]PQJ91483.1 glutaredoxin [Photobacterium phosphoreum]PSV71324.1 glutaredoxin [Photobacterium phosphoreum]
MSSDQGLTIEQLTEYKNVIITQPNCPYCVKAKALLDQQGTEYSTLVLGQQLTKTVMADFIQHVANVNVRTVPQIILAGHYIGGHDDLVAYLERQTDTNDFDDFEL